MTTAHANGDDWPFYLGARNVGFLPAWLSTWLAVRYHHLACYRLPRRSLDLGADPFSPTFSPLSSSGPSRWLFAFLE